MVVPSSVKVAGSGTGSRSPLTVKAALNGPAAHDVGADPQPVRIEVLVADPALKIGRDRLQPTAAVNGI